MTPSGLPFAAAWVIWAVMCAISGIPLLQAAPRLRIAQVIRRAVAAVLGAVLLFVAAMLWRKDAGTSLSPESGNLLLSAVFTVLVLAMTNIGAAVARLMAGRIAAFHARHNATNLQRTPLRQFLAHRPSVKRAAATFFWLGSGQMLYGVWFDLGV